jgi:membrane associated rhomboid family serine protease
MIPLADDNDDRRTWPYVTVAFIVANIICFLYELHVQSQGEPLLAELVTRWGVVPLEYAQKTDLPPQLDGLPFYTTAITSMFLHGGFMHLLGNMLYLWVFGDNVEDRMGRVAFVIFYLVAGLAAAGAQVLADPDSTIPMIGASGAISGVLGAYLVNFPKKRVKVLLGYFIVSVPAVVVLGLWAALQAFATYGTMMNEGASEGGGVAYMAHIGGFVAGVIAGGIYRFLGDEHP